MIINIINGKLILRPECQAEIYQLESVANDLVDYIFETERQWSIESLSFKLNEE